MCKYIIQGQKYQKALLLGSTFLFPTDMVVVVLNLVIMGAFGDILVILFKSCKVFSCLSEFALLHPLADVPVDKRPHLVQEIKLSVEPRPGLLHRRRVGEHAAGPIDLGHVAAGDDGGRLVVDPDLEARRAPVHKLDGLHGLDLHHAGVDILGHDVAPIKEAAGHVLTRRRVDPDHLVGGLEAGVGDVRDLHGLVHGLVGRDEGRVGRHGEVDPRVWHQVGLELVEVHVQGALEPERGRDRGQDLRDHPVEVDVGRVPDVQIAVADVVDGLVVHHEGDLGVVQRRVRRQDGVVRLDHGARDPRRRVDGKLQLGLLGEVEAQVLHQEGGESTSGSTPKRVENQEALEALAILRQPSDVLGRFLEQVLAEGVVATGKVVSRILFPSDQLVGVEKLAIGAHPDLVDDGRLEVDKDRAGDVLPRGRLREESVEGVVAAPEGHVARHHAVGQDPVLEARQLPTRVANLASGLADMDGDALSLEKTTFRLKY